MDIVVRLAAVGQAFDIARQLREFEKSFSDAEFKLKITELYCNHPVWAAAEALLRVRLLAWRSTPTRSTMPFWACFG
ncbi:MAG: hypothetical protein EOR53_30045 [Mesorhizobium sp.]|uniref:hypothetical protein n=1 Tax=Mesorhizobium sp. TaxID=1871066 RepID=UPI000FE98372|nr:hypothetical protein [Mesorhizobium sp.]RWK90833.1 MAG: hypothetical protein EOR53_30045 [Mesorhizobium sp.]